MRMKLLAFAAIASFAMNADATAESSLTPDKHPTREEPSVSVESLLRSGKWNDAVRSILIEARDADPQNTIVPGKLADAGYLDDAIASAEALFPVSETTVLLKIARDAPALTKDQKNDLVQRALVVLRRKEGMSYLKSTDFTFVSLLYVSWGRETDAQAVFLEGLEAAERGPDDKGSDDYRRITEELSSDKWTDIREWMIKPLLSRFTNVKDKFDLAFTYRDLANVRFRQGISSDAKELLSKGLDTADEIGNGMIVLALADVAVDAGECQYAKTLLERGRHYHMNVDINYAVCEARIGDDVAAVETLSKLGTTLYVDHKALALERIIQQAIQRHDIRTATFFADRATDLQKMSFWLLIAQAEADIGNQIETRQALDKAIAAEANRKDRRFYVFETGAMANLVETLFVNGYKDESKKIASNITAELKNTSIGHEADRSRALARFANALSKIEEDNMANDFLAKSYGIAHSIAVKQPYDFEKSSLLIYIGTICATHRQQL